MLRMLECVARINAYDNLEIRYKAMSLTRCLCPGEGDDVAWTRSKAGVEVCVFVVDLEIYVNHVFSVS